MSISCLCQEVIRNKAMHSCFDSTERIEVLFHLQHQRNPSLLHVQAHRDTSASGSHGLTDPVVSQHQSDRGSDSALLIRLYMEEVLWSFHLGSQAVRWRAGCWGGSGARCRDGSRLVVVVNCWT